MSHTAELKSKTKPSPRTVLYCRSQQALVINSSACSGHYTENGVRCLCLCMSACCMCHNTIWCLWCHHVGVLLVMLIPVDFTMCMHITISWTCSDSHLRYSIACRMQIWREKVVMSGKQRVDTWGGGAQRRLLKPSLVLSLRGLKAVSIPFIGHDTRDCLPWNGNYHCRVLPPPVCLLSVYLTHCKWPDLPDLHHLAYSKPLSMCKKFGSGCIL